MCSQRLAVGEAPACVQACPNQAIRIAIVDVAMVVASASLTQDKTSLVPTAPQSRITIPTTRYLSKQPRESTAELVSSECVVDKAHEGHLPLVVMIVLTQASVGMWIVIACVSWLEAGKASFSAATMATLIGIVGVHAALLHLGRPWLAYRAFLGWRTSWLSREAIGFGLFMGVATLAVAFKLLENDGANASNLRYVDSAAAVVGLIAVICTGMIYVATRRELWGGRRTSLDFGLSTIGIGLVGGYAILDCLPSSALVIGTLCSIGAAAPKMLDLVRSIHTTNQWENFSARSGRVVRTDLATHWACLWLLNVTAIGIAIWLALTDLNSEHTTWEFAVFATCLAAQALHRWIYFASVVHRRMPGAST